MCEDQVANQDGQNTGSSAIAELWRRIETWLGAHSPNARKDLHAPATIEAIEQLEKVLGTSLPDDFRQSMQIHDGQHSNLPIFGRWELLESRRVAERWKQHTRIYREQGLVAASARAEGPVRPVWWNLSWVPIATDGGGNDLCLDLDPPARGHRGQLIEYVHDDDVRSVVAPTFRAWLSTYADEIEGEKYEIDDFSGYPVRKA
jgi:cell wall assembly regulator SMI1